MGDFAFRINQNADVAKKSVCFAEKIIIISSSLPTIALQDERLSQRFPYTVDLS